MTKTVSSFMMTFFSSFLDFYLTPRERQYSD